MKFVKSGHVLWILLFLFIWVLTSLSTHCIGHITMGSWKGRGNQYTQLVKVLYCKLPTNGKQLPAFPLEVGLGTEPRSQRWKASVLPLCHHGPLYCGYIIITTNVSTLFRQIMCWCYLVYYNYTNTLTCDLVLSRSCPGVFYLDITTNV